MTDFEGQPVGAGETPIPQVMERKVSKLRSAGWRPLNWNAGSSRVFLDLVLPANRCKVPLREALKCVPTSDEPTVTDSGVLVDGCVAKIVDASDENGPALSVKVKGDYFLEGVDSIASTLVELGTQPASPDAEL